MENLQNNLQRRKSIDLFEKQKLQKFKTRKIYKKSSSCPFLMFYSPNYSQNLCFANSLQELTKPIFALHCFVLKDFRVIFLFFQSHFQIFVLLAIFEFMRTTFFQFSPFLVLNENSILCLFLKATTKYGVLFKFKINWFLLTYDKLNYIII